MQTQKPPGRDQRSRQCSKGPRELGGPRHGPGQKQVFLSVIVKCPPSTRCAGHPEGRDLACPDILEIASESQAIYQGYLAPAGHIQSPYPECLAPLGQVSS